LNRIGLQVRRTPAASDCFFAFSAPMPFQYRTLYFPEHEWKSFHCRSPYDRARISVYQAALYPAIAVLRWQRAEDAHHEGDGAGEQVSAYYLAKF
jgi:hypothetical protein